MEIVAMETRARALGDPTKMEAHGDPMLTRVQKEKTKVQEK